MLIYLIRHGIAQDVSDDGDDASRVLTDEGIRKTRDVSKGLSRLIDPPEMLLCSPKARARQTAEILGKALDVPPRVEPRLAHSDVKSHLDLIQENPVDSIALVGHEPTLSYLIETLCTGTNQSGFVQLKKAGAACVEIERTGKKLQLPGRLLWLAPPKMLAAR